MRELGLQLIRNILSSWGTYAIRLAIAFLFVPYITSVLGEARYGVWIIIFQIVGYFSLADLGLEKALNRFLSSHLAQSDFEAINKVLSTSARACLLIGLFVLIGTGAMAAFGLGVFRIEDPALLDETAQALWIIGFHLALRFWLLPFGGSLNSFQRTDIANGFALLEELLKTIVLVYLLHTGRGLVALALCILAFSLLRQIVAAWWLKTRWTGIRFTLRLGDREMFRRLFEYSRVSFGIGLTSLVLYGSDGLLLGLFISSSAAGIYAPAAQLILYVRHIMNGVAGPLGPVISHLEAVGDNRTIQNVYLLNLKYAGYLGGLTAVGLFVLARPFVALWLTDSFAQAADVMIILACGLVFFLPQIVGNAILYGTSQHKHLLALALIEASLKAALSIILIKDYGLLGVALGTSIPQALMYLVVYPLVMSHLLKIPRTTVYAKLLIPLAVITSVTGPVAWLATTLIAATDWPTFITSVLIVVAAAGAVIYKSLDASELDLYRQLNRATRTGL